MAILLYEQFIYHTQITLHLNIQLFSTLQHSNQLFLVTSWLYSVCNIVTYWVNFR